MFTKVYVKVKDFIKENYRSFCVIIVCAIVLNFPLPFYIEATGGILDISDKIVVDNGYESEGTFHMAYVSEFNANIPTLVMAFLNPNWDILKKEEIMLENETYEDVYFRDRMLLEEANQAAVMLAYQEANKYVQIVKQNLYIIYVDVEADTDLKVGDKIVAVNGAFVSSKEELDHVIQSTSIHDTLSFLVLNDGVEVERYARVRDVDGKKIVGVMLSEQKELDMDPQVTFSFKESETGPSGGLMMTLAIYNSLVPDDLTMGKKIAGTGTIDVFGNVGSIGGVKYKLSGAVKQNADLFFVPLGENYDEAIRLKEEHDYDIEIVGVQTFDEALHYLKNWKG